MVTVATTVKKMISSSLLAIATPAATSATTMARSSTSSATITTRNSRVSRVTPYYIMKRFCGTSSAVGSTSSIIGRPSSLISSSDGNDTNHRQFYYDVRRTIVTTPETNIRGVIGRSQSQSQSQSPSSLALLLPYSSIRQTSNNCSQAPLLKFFSTTTSGSSDSTLVGTDNDKNDINDDISSSSSLQPKYYESRTKRMNTPNNGIEVDLYNRVKRKNRSSPTRDLNYTSDMWRKHKSPWRYLFITSTIFQDSSFQRLMFPELTIITGMAIGLSIITLQADFFGLTGTEFIDNLEIIETGMEPIITTFGTIIALLLGYRVNTTYDRYCDARTMWGELTNASRDLARNICMYIPAHSKNKNKVYRNGSQIEKDSVLMIHNKQRLLNLIRLYPIALHFFLTTKGSHHNLSRKDPDFQKQVYIEFRAECLDTWNKYDKYDDDDNDNQNTTEKNNNNNSDSASDSDDVLLLDSDLIRIFDAFQDKKHCPVLILNMMGECLAELSSSSFDSNKESIINPFYIREMDRQIQRMTSGPFERILRTPMPTAFTRYSSRVTTLWAHTVPFGLITDLGPYFNPLGSLFVCYCVMAIDDIGIQLEEPFNIMPQRQYSDGIVDSVNLIETSFISEQKREHY